MWPDAVANAADKPTGAHMPIAHSVAIPFLSAVQMVNCAQANEKSEAPPKSGAFVCDSVFQKIADPGKQPSMRIDLRSGCSFINKVILQNRKYSSRQRLSSGWPYLWRSRRIRRTPAFQQTLQLYPRFITAQQRCYIVLSENCAGRMSLRQRTCILLPPTQSA